MNRVYGLEDSQAALIGCYVTGQIQEDVLRDHVPGLTADVWVDLVENMFPAECMEAYGRFVQMQSARRMTVMQQPQQGDFE